MNLGLHPVVAWANRPCAARYRFRLFIEFITERHPGIRRSAPAPDSHPPKAPVVQRIEQGFPKP